MKNSKSSSIVLSFIVFIIIGAGCSSSPELVSSWRDPGSTVKFDSLHKILVVAALRDNYNRKFTENRFAARLGNAGVQSYNYFDLNELKSKKEYFIKKFKEDNFDGAIIIRLTSKNTEIKVSKTVPTYYLDYWSFYDYSIDYAMNKGILTRDETFNIEVNVYSFVNNKLVWTGHTSWVNPTSDLDKIVNAIADVVADKMKDEKFLIR